MTARAWYEKVTIPTYGTGKPEKHPMFLEKRVYQGSSGAVYPYPVTEKILDEKQDREWNAVFMENRYLKIMILPELGGRIQMAWDKTKERHFVYYNQVIKPALVGLTGPWISGGIEFNWPQHHRPTTFEPVDHHMEENSDGSVTVWCSEVERMFRTRGMAGFTLYPDKAYLEIRVKLYNRTDQPQTFLWWANPAVKVNDHYQSVFPPDVHAVYDHGKRDVSEFPVARGTYYKVDYSPGTDISRYKNIPVPTSYMAVASKYDFLGGYEHDTQGGLLHVANHHIAPGKKQWTWGNGDFGKAWDRNLTDEDGPYIELMCGVYTDNQPDFSWLMPGEEKSFCQYFMPYRDIGVVKNANKNAMVNLETEEATATVRAYTTGVYEHSKVVLSYGSKVLMEEEFGFHPETSFLKSVSLPETCDPSQLKVTVTSSRGEVLVDWVPGVPTGKPVPQPAMPAREPEEMESVEQLFLTGLHLEQYRHATFNPTDYYHEALRRDPKDSRVNNAMGLWNLRRGNFAAAEEFFRQAVATLTERNPNPIDGEPFYNLGITLIFRENEQEAFDFLYKAVWNSAWQDSGYFQLSRLAMKANRLDEALELADRSLAKNVNHHKAHHIRAAILRKLGRIEEAAQCIAASRALDHFNFGILFEDILNKSGDPDQLDHFRKLIRGNIHTYLEFSLDYAWAGMYDEADRLISLGIEEQGETAVYPLAWYFKAWFQMKAGKEAESLDSLHWAAEACPDYCFPNQPEAVPVLEWAISQNMNDYKALYYLGNFWYHARNYDAATGCWEKSVNSSDRLPSAMRNLALASFNKQKNPEKALAILEKAFNTDPEDARILMELDQLYKRMNLSPEKRLALLEKHPQLTEERDDLYLELATLYNLLGHHEKALAMLQDRKFHPWEGGEGKVTGQYVASLTELAKKEIKKGNPGKAATLLQQSLEYPENLSEGKLTGALENEQYFWLGIACEQMNDLENARNCWDKAAAGMDVPAAAMFYNDQQPDTIFYRGLALKKMGKREQAEALFDRLVEYGEKHENDMVRIDYFAVSLPDLLIWDDNLNFRNRLTCRYLRGLGEWGKGNHEKAVSLFREVSEMNPAHEGSRILLRLPEYETYLDFFEGGKGGKG